MSGGVGKWDRVFDGLDRESRRERTKVLGHVRAVLRDDCARLVRDYAAASEDFRAEIREELRRCIAKLS